MRATLASLAAAVLGLGAAPALAADLPASTRTPASLPIGTAFTAGTFETPSDRDWYRTTLKAGVDYTVSGDDGSGYEVTLRLIDRNGTTVLRSASSEGADTGFEFRPTRDGTYFVEASRAPDRGLRYRVRVSPDCRTGITTKCRLRVGVAQQRLLAYSFDEDWFRLDLIQGRTYSIQSTGGPVLIHDRMGRQISLSSPFRPARTGLYFARALRDADTGSVYRIALTSP